MSITAGLCLAVVDSCVGEATRCFTHWQDSAGLGLAAVLGRAPALFTNWAAEAEAAELEEILCATALASVHCKV